METTTIEVPSATRQRFLLSGLPDVVMVHPSDNVSDALSSGCAPKGLLDRAPPLSYHGLAREHDCLARAFGQLGARIVMGRDFNLQFGDRQFTQDLALWLWDFYRDCWRFLPLNPGELKRFRELPGFTDFVLGQYPGTELLQLDDRDGKVEGGDIIAVTMTDKGPTVFVALRQDEAAAASELVDRVEDGGNCKCPADRLPAVASAACLCHGVRPSVRTTSRGIESLERTVRTCGWRTVVVPFHQTDEDHALHGTTVGSACGRNRRGKRCFLADRRHYRDDARRVFNREGLELLYLPDGPPTADYLWGANGVCLSTPEGDVFVAQDFPEVLETLDQAGIEHVQPFEHFEVTAWICGSPTCNSLVRGYLH